jgi:hypothetical protein
MRCFVLFWLAAAAAGAQIADLHDSARSARVPQSASSFGPSEINSQLQVLSERLAAIQKTVDRIDESQSRGNDRVRDVELKITAMQSREQGKSEQSDNSFKWLSGAVVPLISAILGGIVVSFLSRKYPSPAEPPMKAKSRASGRS